MPYCWLVCNHTFLGIKGNKKWTISQNHSGHWMREWVRILGEVLIGGFRVSLWLTSPNYISGCRYSDKHRFCAYWASQGFCKRGHTDYMNENCQKSCLCVKGEYRSHRFHCCCLFPGNEYVFVSFCFFLFNAIHYLQCMLYTFVYSEFLFEKGWTEVSSSSGSLFPRPREGK